MAYKALSVANKFLALAERDGLALDPMKLQKLIYYANGWHLALTGRPAILEQVEAWKYGPVIANVYQHFKSFGQEPITTMAADWALVDGDLRRVPVEVPDDPTTNGIIETVWDSYKGMTGVQLSNLTHLPGTAWYRVRSDIPGGVLPDATPIPTGYIKDEFDAKRRDSAVAA